MPTRMTSWLDDLIMILIPILCHHLHLDGRATLELLSKDVASIIAEVCAIRLASLLPHDVGLDADL